MICPACASALSRVEYEGIYIETCSDCKGEWVEGNRLRRIESRREVDVTQKPASGAAPRPRGPEIRRTCPRCVQTMRKYQYGKDKSIIVDQCPKCKGIWLDDGELEAVRDAHKRWEEFVRTESRRRVPATRARRAPSREGMAANFARSMTKVSLTVLIGKWILSLVILLGPAVAILYAVPLLAGLTFWLIYTGIWLVLLLIARYVEFVPDHGDLGWFGGLMNDPFSCSDDWNRFLLSCKVIFAIPKFVVNTFCDTLDAVKG